MLNKLKQMMQGFAGEAQDANQIAKEDQRLAAAALLVHATLIDGELAPEEQSKLHELLENNYDLSPSETTELIKMAEKEDEDAVDLFRFTRRLNRALEPKERLKIIEMLWEIAFSDGVLHEFESNLIWRVAELMHVSPRDRIFLRQQVKARLNITD